MAVATMEETLAGQLSNDRHLPTRAASVSRLRHQNWVHVCKDL